MADVTDLAEAILAQEERFVVYRLREEAVTGAELRDRLRPWMNGRRTRAALARLVEAGQVAKAKERRSEDGRVDVYRLTKPDRC